MQTKLLSYPEDKDIINYICRNMDFSILRSFLWSEEGVKESCEQAAYYHFNSVVAYPNNYKIVYDALKGSGVKTLLGFGDYARMSMEGKLVTAREAFAYGVQETDLVLNVPYFKDKKYNYVLDELTQMVNLAKFYGVTTKLVLEVGFLTEMEKKLAVDLAVDAGIDYIKVATGREGSGKCNMHDILWLKECINGRCKLKASGAIDFLEDAWAYMEAGADRTAGREGIIHQLKYLGV